MSSRGAALLLSLLLVSLLAVAALSAAFMGRTHLLLARNRALALQADAVALSGAAVAMARIAAEVRSTGTLPPGLTLPVHPEYPYGLRSYTLLAADRARFEVEGVTAGGGRALVTVVVTLEGGVPAFQLLH